MLNFKNRVAVYHYGKKVIEALGRIHVISSESFTDLKPTTYTNKEDYTKYLDALTEQGLIKNSYQIDYEKGILWID